MYHFLLDPVFVAVCCWLQRLVTEEMIRIGWRCRQPFRLPSVPLLSGSQPSRPALSARFLASNRYSEAEATLNTLPELKAANETPDATAAYDHLKRALDIVSNAGDHKLVVVAHGYLAQLCYRVGQPDAEGLHRLMAIKALKEDAGLEEDSSTIPGDPDAAGALSNAFNGLSLCRLRANKPGNMDVASAAAKEAELYAQSASMRLAASLHKALALQRGSAEQRLVLSALSNMSGEVPLGQSGEPDVPGFATLFLALFAETDVGGPSDEKALGRLKALLSRWEDREGFDLVELQCAAARQMVTRGPSGAGNSANLDAAEGLLVSALKSSERLGNKLDMAEPLLGLAHLYAAQSRKIEAEGMFRSVEERFSGLMARSAFNVLSAEVFCRVMDEFALFLDGVGRESEAESKRRDAAKLRAQFPHILGTPPPVPLWFVDSCIDHYAVSPSPKG